MDNFLIHYHGKLRWTSALFLISISQGLGCSDWQLAMVDVTYIFLHSQKFIYSEFTSWSVVIPRIFGSKTVFFAFALHWNLH